MNAPAMLDSATSRKDLALLLARQIIATARADRAAALVACDSAMEILVFHAPDLDPSFLPFWHSEREECAFWADFAPDTLAAEMLSGLLKRFTGKSTVARTAKKRALVALWGSLDPDDRAAFLARVDPDGAFRAP